MRENKFKQNLKKEIEEMLPGCLQFDLDPNEYQGIPDLLILYNDKWASLECKRKKDAPHRPNQDVYVELMNKMSFSRFIFPENKEEVLNELQRSFSP